MIGRILAGAIGVITLFIFSGWVIDPMTAAQGLQMTLQDGMGGNTQIGDFSAFFFTAGIFACLGAYRNEHVWLYTPFAILLSAAVFRSLAVILHSSEPLVSAIIFEIILAALLAGCIYLMRKERAAE
jgi:hypothetical protein